MGELDAGDGTTRRAVALIERHRVIPYFKPQSDLAFSSRSSAFALLFLLLGFGHLYDNKTFK